jgi:hypothetical protein
MKTTIIPAQITTVEDKIAGKLSLTQILILMVPVFWAGMVYIILAPRMALVLYKVALALPILIVSFVLSLRIDDKLVINWITLLLRYNNRPKYFVFNKNDSFLRSLDLPVLKNKLSKFVRFAKSRKKVVTHYGVMDQIAFEKDKENITFKTNGKGGLNVIFDQIKK